MPKLGRKVLLTLVVLVMLSACEAVPNAPFATRSATPTDESECDWANAFPTEEAQIAWPMLVPLEVEDVAPGDELEITAFGGYLHWDTECGEAFDESSNSFHVYFDGDPIGNITCYVNVCRVTLAIPADAPPGTHTLSVEGGSTLELVVVAP